MAYIPDSGNVQSFDLEIYVPSLGNMQDFDFGGLGIAVNEIITVNEDLLVNFPNMLFLLGADNISVAESMAANVSAESQINVYDAVAVTESVAREADVLFVAVYEPEYIVITEHVDVIDLIVEVGIVVEYNYIADWLDAYLDALYISEAYDDIVAAELALATIPILNIALADDISASESLELLLSDPAVSVFDDVLASEFILVDSTGGALFIVVGDDIAVAEPVSAYIDELYIEQMDDIVMVEYVVMLDIVIELGVAWDDIAMVDDIAIEVPIDFTVDDQAAVAEEATIELDSLFIYVLDPYHVLITEHAEVLDLIVEVGVVMEPIGVAEDVAAAVPINAEAIDTVSVAEDIAGGIVSNISVADTVRVGTQSDELTEAITVSEYYIAVFDKLGLAVVDTVSVAEDISAYPDLWFVTVDELIASIEVVQRDMPINFDVAEQRGICIVTVSGW